LKFLTHDINKYKLFKEEHILYRVPLNCV